MIDLKKLREILDECYGTVVMSEKEFSELLTEIEAAQKDAARIDWLESSKDSHGFCHSGNGDYRHYALQMEGYKNVREVIDEAMASKS